MKSLQVLSSFLIILRLSYGFVRDFQSLRRSLICIGASKQDSGPPLSVMVNGMPGPMAVEVAKACLDRNLNLLNYGFTGPLVKESTLVVEGAERKVEVSLLKGLGSAASTLRLKEIKKANPNLIVVDFTHPAAASGNVQAYVQAECDFVMGTTGFNPDEISKSFELGYNYAIIAPNMAKQIVALQAAIQETAQRFPGSFKGYSLSVTESHQSSKVDTSGTAKVNHHDENKMNKTYTFWQAIVNHLSTLNDQSFPVDNIVKVRERSSQIEFGVPEDALNGHAFHTYQFKSADGR